MDRLTVHGATSQRDIDRLMELSNENQFGRNKAYYRLQEYEDLGFTPEEIAIMAKFYKEQTSVSSITANLKLVGQLGKLDKYEKLKKAGRLVVLPCKVGDTVYCLDYNTDACKGCDCYSDFYGMDSICDEKYELHPEFGLDEDDYCPKHFIEIREFRPDLMEIVIHLDDFGKTVFFTREEAEAELERRQNGTKDRPCR